MKHTICSIENIRKEKNARNRQEKWPSSAIHAAAIIQCWHTHSAKRKIARVSHSLYKHSRRQRSQN